MNLHEKSGFLNKVLRPRSLCSLAPPTADRPLAARGLAGINAMGFLTSPANQSKLNGP